MRTPEGNIEEYPLMKLKEIAVIGKGISFSTDLLYQAVKLGVRVSFLDRLGRHYVTVASPYLTQSIGTARAQMREYHTQKRFDLAKAIILKKIRNQAQIIRVLLNKHGIAEEKIQRFQEWHSSIEEIARQLENEHISEESGREVLFSFEGRAANLYWNAFEVSLEGKAKFPGRIGRGAKDPINILLNYGYTMLLARVESAALSCGFIPFAGFLHADRSGKPSFILDVMELFRQPIVDHAVVTFLRERERKIETIYKNLLKDFARHVQKYFGKTLLIGGKNYSYEYGIYMQIQNIASFLKGEKELNIYDISNDALH